MSGFKDQDRINDLRQRLYDRGTTGQRRAPYSLAKAEEEEVLVEQPKITQEEDPEEIIEKPEMPRSQVGAASDIKPRSVTPAPAVSTQTQFTPASVSPPEQIPETEALKEEFVSNAEPMSPKKRSRRYRLKILLAGIFFFIVAVGLSSFWLMNGDNTISGQNITLTMDGPFTIGGGETMSIMVSIANLNSVPINAATLIVEYPQGTQSSTEGGQELFIERLSLDTVGSGETLNVPIKAVVFGEENSEKEITVTVEYRVEGSNATFVKDAEPLRFKISSSPVVLQMATNKKVSSGQETEIDLKVTSNSPTELTNILVKADYPTGFDFIESDPDPVAGTNTWLIDSLDPGESVDIKIKAILVGKESDELAAHFVVGVPNDRDPFNLSSEFTKDSISFEIESPFLGVDLDVSGNGNEAVVELGESVSVSIEFTNTLSDTIYDAVITAVISGNAVDDRSVEVPNGFYDSRSNTITWNSSELSDLEQLVPGASERVSFALVPEASGDRTPQIDIDVNVKARRVSENDVSEELTGTARGFAKVASVPKIMSEAGYNVRSFSGSGPVPPVAEETTAYTLTMFVDNGTNQISNAEVTTSLPSYVTWLNKTDGDGSISYNQNTRVITWNAGSIDGNDNALMSFQVSILPSVTQIDTTPTLMGEQRLKATDQFTGSTVRSTRPAVTTELSTETGFEEGNGRIQTN